jgi:hypothetical protein
MAPRPDMRIMCCKPSRTERATVNSMKAFTCQQWIHNQYYARSCKYIKIRLTTQQMQFPVTFKQSTKVSQCVYSSSVGSMSMSDNFPTLMWPSTYRPPFFRSFTKWMSGHEDRGFPTKSSIWGLQNLTWSFRESSISKYFRTWREKWRTLRREQQSHTAHTALRTQYQHQRPHHSGLPHWQSIVTWWKMRACEMEPQWASREGEKRCRMMTRTRHSTIAVDA